jgi:hypothetical protein
MEKIRGCCAPGPWWLVGKLVDPDLRLRFGPLDTPPPNYVPATPAPAPWTSRNPKPSRACGAGRRNRAKPPKPVWIWLDKCHFVRSSVKAAYWRDYNDFFDVLQVTWLASKSKARLPLFFPCLSLVLFVFDKLGASGSAWTNGERRGRARGQPSRPVRDRRKSLIVIIKMIVSRTNDTIQERSSAGVLILKRRRQETRGLELDTTVRAHSHWSM